MHAPLTPRVAPRQTRTRASVPAARGVGPVLAIALALAAGVGCGPSGAGPALDPLSDQTAYVGSEFTLEIRASDPDSPDLRFSFTSDLGDLDGRAEIRPYGQGVAVFSWTPVASDVGTHSFDFRVSDGNSSATETITIEVKSGVGEENAPIFRKPLGTGTTLDLSATACLDVEVVVEDQDTPEVVIDQDEPRIEGAELTQESGTTATWRWCPTPSQIAAQDRYTLTLSASDQENPKSIKNFLIVLRQGDGGSCPGDAPVISHTPENVSTIVGLTIDAHVTDDAGLKGEPLLYYSTTAPSTPPDLGQMTQVTMQLIDGTMKDGTWAADVPNPVASSPAGSSKKLYYVIVASDNDDSTGSCDHVTSSPASGSHSITVTNPGGSGNLGLCAACTADVQCGGSDDNCVRMGSEGNYYCFEGCTSDSQCPTGYYCSITELTSIDGAKGRQCIPEDYSCTNTTTTSCVDDSKEENDTRSVASGNSALATGTHSSLVSCPAGTSADDEDWYKITISGDSQVTLKIVGGDATDLDLQLTDSTGTVLAESESLTSTETIMRCLGTGTYYVRVYAWGVAKNTYTLTYSKTSTTCSSTSCTDDSREPDDSPSSARFADLDAPPYTSTANQICSYDDDWYELYLFSGETLHATLKFSQSSPDEDLDINFYKDGSPPVDLINCTEIDISGCSDNGQSNDANENFKYTATSAGFYYVVVHGWNGAQNSYDICLGLSSTQCPTLP